MATKNISDLERFSSIETGDFFLVINTGTRVPKKIAVEDAIFTDRNTVVSRYRFSRNSFDGFNNSVSVQTGDFLENSVYSTPETIRFTGFTGSANTALNSTYSLSGIQNDNLAWSSGNFSIVKSGSETYWNLNSGSSGLFQFSSGLTYPNFGPINLLNSTGGFSGVNESGVVSFQTKSSSTPIFFGQASPVTGLFESTCNFPIESFESADIDFLYSTQTFPSSNSGNLIFDADNSNISSGQKSAATSITATGLTQTIFTLGVTGLQINKLIESGSGAFGNFSFNNSLNSGVSITNSPVVTGIMTNDSVDLQNTKPSIAFKSLDIDNDGLVTSGVDLVLLDRYFNGTTGNALITGLSFSGSGVRSGYADIQNFIQSGIDLNSYDVNEDGFVGSDDINFILNFGSGSGVPITGRNAMKSGQLQSNISTMYNV